LIALAVVVVFCVAYLKKIVVVTPTPDDAIPDIPSGWQMVILGILGIRALQAGAAAFIKSRKANSADDDPVAESPKNA
jgi:hypothetical protein